MNCNLYEGDELYATLMSHREFHDNVIEKYAVFLHKHKHGSSSFINDRLRVYCRDNDIQYTVKIGIACVKMMDEYVREEMRLGNK